MTTYNKDYYKKWLFITNVTIINDYFLQEMTSYNKGYYKKWLSLK